MRAVPKTGMTKDTAIEVVEGMIKDWRKNQLLFTEDEVEALHKLVEEVRNDIRKGE